MPSVEVMEAAALLVLSLVSCFVGFALEVAQGNIHHVQNGRVPNAGAALLPNIAAVPLTYVGAAWAIDRWRPELGFKVVASYAVLAIAAQWIAQRRAARRLRALIESAADEPS